MFSEVQARTFDDVDLQCIKEWAVLKNDLSTGMENPAKRTTLLQRRVDWSPQEFSDYWAGPHAAIALGIPHVTTYTQNRVIRPLWSLAGVPAFECDGVVELEFLDAPSMLDAGQSLAVRELLPADELRFLRGITLCSVPRGARQIQAGVNKVMLAACPRDGWADFRALLERCGSRVFSVDPVHSVGHRPGLTFEPDPPQFFATLWFPVAADMYAAFAPGSAWDARSDGVFRRATVWHMDPLPIIV